MTEWIRRKIVVFKLAAPVQLCTDLLPYNIYADNFYDEYHGSMNNQIVHVGKS